LIAACTKTKHPPKSPPPALPPASLRHASFFAMKASASAPALHPAASGERSLRLFRRAATAAALKAKLCASLSRPHEPEPPAAANEYETADPNGLSSRAKGYLELLSASNDHGKSLFLYQHFSHDIPSPVRKSAKTRPASAVLRGGVPIRPTPAFAEPFKSRRVSHNFARATRFEEGFSTEAPTPSPDQYSAPVLGPRGTGRASRMGGRVRPPPEGGSREHALMATLRGPGVYNPTLSLAHQRDLGADLQISWFHTNRNERPVDRTTRPEAGDYNPRPRQLPLAPYSGTNVGFGNPPNALAMGKEPANGTPSSLGPGTYSASRAALHKHTAHARVVARPRAAVGDVSVGPAAYNLPEPAHLNRFLTSPAGRSGRQVSFARVPFRAPPSPETLDMVLGKVAIMPAQWKMESTSKEEAAARSGSQAEGKAGDSATSKPTARPNPNPDQAGGKVDAKADAATASAADRLDQTGHQEGQRAAEEGGSSAGGPTRSSHVTSHEGKAVSWAQ